MELSWSFYEVSVCEVGPMEKESRKKLWRRVRV